MAAIRYGGPTPIIMWQNVILTAKKPEVIKLLHQNRTCYTVTVRPGLQFGLN